MATVKGPDHTEVAPVKGEDGPGLMATCQDDDRSVRDADHVIAIPCDHLGAHLQIP